MAKPQFKFQMYKRLQANLPKIYADAKKAADSLNIPAELKGAMGLTGAISGCPSPLREDIEKSMAAEARKVVPLSRICRPDPRDHQGRLRGRLRCGPDQHLRRRPVDELRLPRDPAVPGTRRQLPDPATSRRWSATSIIRRRTGVPIRRNTRISSPIAVAPPASWASTANARTTWTPCWCRSRALPTRCTASSIIRRR